MFEYEFRIFGLRRSGNHSLIHLLLSQFPDNSVFYYNDIQYPEYLFSHPTYKTSYSQRPIHSKDVKLMGNLCEKLVNKKEYELKELVKPKPRLCLIQSYEDQDLPTIMEKIKIQESRKISSKKVFNILVIRDYKNWLASRINAWKKTDYKNNYLRVNSKILSLWSQYIKEHQGKTSYLDNLIIYNFNKMGNKPKCRIKILKEVGLFEKKESWKKIVYKPEMIFGNGSSFDERENNNNFNQRYKLLNNNRIYKECVKFKNLDELSNIVFPNVK